MPSISGWLGNTNIPIVDEETRAAAAWNRIQDRPTSITLYRNESALGAQTVRLEYSEATTSAQMQGVAGQPSERQLIVFGVRNHPTVAATNIQRGDMLQYETDTYVIVDVIRLPGEIQAYTERLQGGG
ncbi:MAG: hypothetical protein K8L91_07940 [Anaerolineae bacterium]|nr:MAG: hypothetical protein F9K46_09030 [Anaerolineae bacterium]MBZ0316333.1 hypothetical protein [Anaerolineae bacterium]